MTQFQGTYPKKVQITYFPQDADTRDDFLADYIMYETLNNEMEEIKFYENLDHEANIRLDFISR